MAQRLTDMTITRVSLVDKGANRKGLAVLKRDEEAAMGDGVAKDGAESPAGQASLLRKIADWITGRSEVAKAQTFGSIIAGRELSDALDDSYDTLWSALWSAMYAYDATGQDLPMADKQALVSQSLDEFKAYLLAAMQTGIGKRERPSAAAIAKHRLEVAIEKVGAKVSAARLERLKAAAEALNSVLAEVDQENTEKRASAQEDDMTSEELAKALEPITGRLDAIEKRLPPEKSAAADAGPVKKDGEAEDELTLEGLAKAFIDHRNEVDGKFEAIAKARGERTSADGQEAGAAAVKKSRWAGIF